MYVLLVAWHVTLSSVAPKYIRCMYLYYLIFSDHYASLFLRWNVVTWVLSGVCSRVTQCFLITRSIGVDVKIYVIDHCPDSVFLVCPATAFVFYCHINELFI